MSIIYEALKRIENKTKKALGESSNPAPAEGASPPAPQRPKPNQYRLRQLIYIFCILALLGLLSLFVERPSQEKSAIDKAVIPKPRPSESTATDKKAPTSVQPLSTPEKKTVTAKVPRPPKLSLTGLFFSEGHYIALINNKMIEVGDEIQGAKVINIDSNGVEIDFEGSRFLLKRP